MWKDNDYMAGIMIFFFVNFVNKIKLTTSTCVIFIFDFFPVKMKVVPHLEKKIRFYLDQDLQL